MALYIPIGTETPKSRLNGPHRTTVTMYVANKPPQVQDLKFIISTLPIFQFFSRESLASARALPPTLLELVSEILMSLL